jgi:hypothetical protein
VLALLSRLPLAANAAEEGKKVIFGMLIVGLIFLLVIAVGELVERAGHRRAERRRRLRPY